MSRDEEGRDLERHRFRSGLINELTRERFGDWRTVREEGTSKRSRSRDERREDKLRRGKP